VPGRSVKALQEYPSMTQNLQLAGRHLSANTSESS